MLNNLEHMAFTLTQASESLEEILKQVATLQREES